MSQIRISIHMTILAGLGCLSVGVLYAASDSGSHELPGDAHADIAAMSESALDTHLQAQIAKLGLQPLAAPTPRPAPLVALGQALFSERALSGNRNIACIDCHEPTRGTGDGLRLAVGQEHGPGGGALLGRNTPPLYNLGRPGVQRLFRDGRVRYDPSTDSYHTPEPALNGVAPTRSDITAVLDGALSAQVLFPLLNRAEMRGYPGANEVADAADSLAAWRAIVARLRAQPDYAARFATAYPESIGRGEPVHIGHVGRALAAYIRETFAVTDTPYDRYLRGQRSALTIDAKRGMALFLGKAHCVHCHNGPHLSDSSSHANAVPQIGPGTDQAHDDLGEFPHVESATNHLYQFRTPPLRNIGKTAPYMHDGAFTDLRAVIEHYQDPVASVERYTKSGWSIRQRERSLQIDRNRFRNQLRLSMRSPPLRTRLLISEREVDYLVVFLQQGLTQ